MPVTPPGPVAVGGLPATLKAALDRAGYAEPALTAVFGGPPPPIRRLLRQSPDLGPAGPLATFVRLFLLGHAVPADDLRDALQPLAAEDLFASGLLTGDPTEPRSTVQIMPFDGLYLAADWPDGESEFEPVMGVAASTRALAKMMIPSTGSALDLGAGCGVLAITAARTAAKVVAVDLNPRAVALARLNAALNGVTNVDCRAGNLFDPVAGETFDLIVCNPPFVIAPAAGRMHSQTGRPNDEFVRSIVRAVPPFLRPGGFCQLVANWVVPAGGAWQERLAGWFAGLGCDAWALHAHTEDAATYARRRIDELTDDPVEAGRLVGEWTDYYTAHGIAAVGFGIITLRAISGRVGWTRIDQLPPIDGPCGPSIAEWFARRDFLDAHAGDHAVLTAHVRRADDLVFENGRIRRSTGLLFTGAADPAVTSFINRCDGSAPLGEELTRLAVQFGRDRPSFAPAFLGVVRRLIEAGVLVPAASIKGIAGPVAASGRPADS
jgi:SAM-dependent methyltransferase